jgi:hypothetical protein
MIRICLLCLALVFAAGCGPACKNSECPADEVCASGGCAAALSATYRVTLNVQVAAKEPDGTDWDSASAVSSASPPDPGASLSRTGETFIADFTSASDTYKATLVRDHVRFDVDGGSSESWMSLHVFDEDGLPGSGEAICDAFVGPDAVTVLHAGFWDGGTKGSCSSISMEFEAE